MKATTQTRYECTDGRTFGDKGLAQRHELELFCKGKLDEDVKLTVPVLMSVMLGNAEEFGKKLKEVAA